MTHRRSLLLVLLVFAALGYVLYPHAWDVLHDPPSLAWQAEHATWSEPVVTDSAPDSRGNLTLSEQPRAYLNFSSTLNVGKVIAYAPNDGGSVTLRAFDGADLMRWDGRTLDVPRAPKPGEYEPRICTAGRCLTVREVGGIVSREGAER